MKNNKGFAITIVVFSLLILLIAFMFLILGVLRNEYKSQKDFVEETKQELNEIIKEKNEGTKYTLTISKGTGIQTITNTSITCKVEQDGKCTVELPDASNYTYISGYNTLSGYNDTNITTAEYLAGDSLTLMGDKVVYAIAKKNTVYAWNKWTVGSVNQSLYGNQYGNVVVYGSSSSEIDYDRYYTTPAYNEIVEKGTNVSGSYNTYTNFNALKGKYYIWAKNANNLSQGWNTTVRYIPSNATIKRKIDNGIYLVYFTYMYDVTSEKLTANNADAYPTGWSGTTIYYEYLGEEEA